MKLGFAGGANEVGGSCICVRTEQYGLLLDAGIRQGKGRDPLPDFRTVQDLGGVDAILISHAHMDHIGSLPLISRAYPSARIYMTPMTMDLTRVLLLDSLKIMAQREEEIPIYGEAEVSAMMDRIVPVPFQAEREILPGIQAAFYPAGHIAGAACVFLKTPEGSLFYSGDYASFPQQTIDGLRIPRLRPDLCITETTYGDRLHANRQVEESRLIRLVGEAVQQGKKVLIPSFALGRAQEVLLLLKQGMQNGQIPEVPVYVDGMVRDICRVYRLHPTFLKGRLGRSILKGNEPFYTGTIRPVEPMEDRNALLENKGPAVFVASSGMLSGGPSVLYAAKIAAMEDGLILITGYQDEEAPGRALLDLAREAEENRESGTIALNGLSIPVRARVERVGLSAHGDQQEILNLLQTLSPREVFLVHGDPEVIASLAPGITGPFLRNVCAPVCGDVITVGTLNPRKQRNPVPLSSLSRTGFPDASGEEELWRFWLEKYPDREMSAIQLSELWSGRPETDSAAIQAWHDLARQSDYFEMNPHRLFLFHPRTESEVELRRAPHELNQQEAGDLAAERFAAFPFVRVGLYPDRKAVVFAFHFPDAVDSDAFQACADAFLEETGWTAEINPAVNLMKMEELIRSLLGDRVEKISHFVPEKTTRVSLSRAEPADEAGIRAFAEKTGWTLSAGETRRGQPALPAGEFIPGSTVMEQNAALTCLRKTADALHMPLQKCGIKSDHLGKYIEVTFITPALGQRYGETLTELAQDTGWRIRVSSAVLQNLVLPIASAAAEAQGLALRKNPSYMPMQGCVQICLQTRNPEAEDRAAAEILEKTGLPCSFRT